jgi:hypothetical protein
MDILVIEDDVTELSDGKLEDGEKSDGVGGTTVSALGRGIKRPLLSQDCAPVMNIRVAPRVLCEATTRCFSATRTGRDLSIGGCFVVLVLWFWFCGSGSVGLLLS